MSNITVEKLKQGEIFQVEARKELSDKGLIALNTKEDGSIQRVKICEPIFVDRTFNNLDSGEHFLIIVSKVKGIYEEQKHSREILIPNKLSATVKYGNDIPAESEKIISRYLSNQSITAPHSFVYSKVGWNSDKEGQLEFRLDKSISNDSKYIAINDQDSLRFNVSCKGSIEDWINMYSNEVKGNTALEAMICISFSAVIVGYLNKTEKDVDTLIIHLAGKSTTGKTTATKLALSIFGLPDIRNKGLLRTWNATANSMINSLGGNFGVPMAFDELSMVNQKSITKELYTIASGLEKARLSNYITQRNQQTWATTIISTGEQSIFEKTNNNAGLRVRAICFEGVEWTKSAENAENIKKTINNNYGNAGVEYVKHIFNQGFQIIDDKFQQWRDKSLEVMPGSEYKNRIANKFSAILTAGDIANEALGLNIDLEAVLNFLSANEAESIKERDFGEKAFLDMIQVIIQNISNFKTSNSYSTPRICWGIIENDFGNYQVMILKNVLQRELRALNNEDPKIVIREWKKKGYLKSEGDRASIRRQVFSKDEQEKRMQSLGVQKVPKGKLADTVYILKVPKEYLKEYLTVNTFPTPVS